MEELAKAAVVFDPVAQAAMMTAQVQSSQRDDSSQSVDIVSEQLRRSAEKNLQLKMQELKKQTQTRERESFTVDDHSQKRWQEALDGRLGPEAQAAAHGWDKNGDLQQKLTDSQKRLFREAMAQEPQKTAQAGKAIDHVTREPGFARALTNSQQVGAIVSNLMQNPKLEKAVGDMLQTRFMQAPNADTPTKSDFMRFGMQQVARGNTVSVKVAGDMLGSLAETRSPRFAQRAAMNMAQRNPANTEGMRQVDGFVRQRAVQQLPNFARGTATSLLAKADGARDVGDGFQKLASDPAFRAQNNATQGRFFATIGSGRPTELRAVTDKVLQALQSTQFPTRQAQVSRFLSKLGNQVSSKGAAGVNVKSLMKSSKGSPLPPVPLLTSTEGLSDEETHKVRAQNRSKVIQYYTQVSRSYEQVDKRLSGAKYFEDINMLPNLRDAEAPNAEHLAPEDQLFVSTKSKQLKARYSELKKMQQIRTRELRTRRISPQQRRMQERRYRAAGEQPRYFNPRDVRAPTSRNAPLFPEAGLADASAASTRGPLLPQQNRLPQNPEMAASTLPRTPSQANRQSLAPSPALRAAGKENRASGRTSRPGNGGQRSAGSALDADAILSQLPENAPMEERLQKAKQIMAKQWEAQMKDVMGRIFDDGSSRVEAVAGHAGAEHGRALVRKATESQLADAPRNAPGSPRETQNGNFDGWGIQRTFPRDLGAGHGPAVRPPEAAKGDVELSDEPTYEQMSAERYTGRTIARQDQVRDSAALFNATWRDTGKDANGMNKAEMAVLRNLGWNQQTWDTKQSAQARWPQTMRTRFAKLGPTQRESVRKLGLSAEDWDEFVHSLT